MTERKLITRTAPLLDYEIERSGDGRVVVAYAAAFNNDYEVSDQDGHYDERVNPAAFNKVLARSGSINNVQVYFNHGLTLWGTPSDRYSAPVGVPEEITPDGRGLLTRTRYAKSELGEEMLQLWRDGAIRGQSFRGAIYESRTVSKRGPNGRPVIERLQLGLKEYGPTPHPANSDAGLVAIRSQLLEQVGELTDEERIELAKMLEDFTPNPVTDPQPVPDDDPVAPVAPVVSPDPGLSIEVLEAAAAHRRRRAE